MKKYLSILCALTLMATAFVSCGGSDDDDDEKEKTKSSASDEKDDDDSGKSSKKKSKKDDAEFDDSYAKSLYKAANTAIADLDMKDVNVTTISYIVTAEGELQTENTECERSLAEEFVECVSGYVDDFDKVPYALLYFRNCTCVEVFVGEEMDEKATGIYSNEDDADDLAKMTLDKIYENRKDYYQAEEKETESAAERSTKAVKLEDDNNDNGGNNDKDEALELAKSYIEYSDFSYLGLIDQIEYEGYSHDAAVYAADNCGADWMEEALESAMSYIEYGDFSEAVLLEQLLWEDFTEEEAEYGVKNCGADWIEEAEGFAKSYMEYNPDMTKDELTEMLEFEEFTEEQIKAGLKAAGF